VEDFEAPGIWWPAETGPENRTTGVLRFKKGDGLRLKLFGTRRACHRAATTSRHRWAMLCEAVITVSRVLEAQCLAHTAAPKRCRGQSRSAIALGEDSSYVGRVLPKDSNDELLATGTQRALASESKKR